MAWDCQGLTPVIRKRCGKSYAQAGGYYRSGGESLRGGYGGIDGDARAISQTQQRLDYTRAQLGASAAASRRVSSFYNTLVAQIRHDRSATYSASKPGHAFLDLVGLIPVLGEPADGVNGIWYGAEGDYVNAGLSAGAMIPIIGAGATTAKYGKKGVDAASVGNAARSLTATERRTLDDALRPDKLDHVFDPKHNFQPLIRQFGSREAAMEQIVRSIGGPLPQSGRFEIAQNVGGQSVVIRGAVVDGVPRIGTAFTP